MRKFSVNALFYLRRDQLGEVNILMKAFRNKKISILLLAIVIIALVFLGTRVFGQSDNQQTYRTAKVEKGTLISSVSASGQVSRPGAINVTSQATGVVQEVYVKNGDSVRTGDKILAITLDQTSLTNQAKAYSSYLAAQNALDSAIQNKLSLQSALQTAQNTVTNFPQTKLQLQGAIDSAQSALIAAQIDWNDVQDKPDNDPVKQQKEANLKVAQDNLTMAQQNLDQADSAAALTKLTLQKDVDVAQAALISAQNNYNAALGNSKTTAAELQQLQANLAVAQDAYNIALANLAGADYAAAQTKEQLQQKVDSAQAAVLAAQNDLNSLQKSDLVKQQKYNALVSAQNALNLAQQKLASSDSDLQVAQLNLSLAQQKLNSADSAINEAEANLSAAKTAYDQIQSVVTAPIDGTVSDLTLVKGSVITGSSGSSASSSSSSSSSTTTSSAGSSKIASILTPSLFSVSANVSEVDIPKIKQDQKATITLDAVPDKTFTGKVAGIDRTGVVSSGVTNYPVIVQFEDSSQSVTANMSASVNIITEVKDNVLMIPTSAIQKVNNQAMARVLDQGKLSFIPVVTGSSSDSQTEIISGLSEGQEVVTAVVTKGASQTSNPFGGTMRGFGAGGGRGPGG